MACTPAPDAGAGKCYGVQVSARPANAFLITRHAAITQRDAVVDRCIINFRMSAPLLLTKIYVPPPRPKIVLRPRLVERLNEGMNCKLTLISAPAGFGKTTLVSKWIADCGLPVAWLSLDEGDNAPTSFLAYL